MRRPERLLAALAGAVVVVLLAASVPMLPHGIRSPQEAASGCASGGTPPACDTPRTGVAPADWEDADSHVNTSWIRVQDFVEAVDDPADGYVLLIADANGSSWGFGGTWEYSHGTFSELHPTLSPTDYGPLAYDAADGYPVMVDTQTNPVTTWNFSHDSWHYLATASSPSHALTSGSYYDQMAYDPGDHQVVLASTAENPAYLFLWAFAGGVWTNDSTSVGAPPGSTGDDYTIADDAGDGYLILWSSVANGSTDYNTTWRLGPSGWTVVCTGCGLGGEDRGSTGAYDPAVNALIVFGGYLYYLDTQPSAITRSFAAGNWSVLHPAISPDPAAGDLMVYDSADGYLLMIRAPQYFGDTASVWWYGPGIGVAYPVTLQIFPPTLGAVYLGAAPAPLYTATRYGSGSVINLTDGTYGIIPVPAGADCYFYDGLSSPCPGGWGIFEGWTFSGGSISDWNLTVNGAGGWLNVTFTAAAVVTGQSSECGPIEFGGQSIANGGTADLAPSPPDYAVSASTCSGYAFQGWAESGGVTLASLTEAVTTATLVSNATLAAVYAVRGSGNDLQIGSFSATPDPVELNQTTDIVLSADGGSGGNSYAVIGLPSNCYGLAERSEFECAPQSVGQFDLLGTVTDASGESATTGLVLRVSGSEGPLRITQFGSNTSGGSSGTNLSFVVQVTGGLAPFTYAYSGLPRGCTSVNAPEWTCAPTALGRFVVEVTVVDASGLQVTANASLQLGATPAHPLGTAGSGSTFDDFLAGIGAIAVLAAVGYLFQRWLARRPPA